MLLFKIYSKNYVFLFFLLIRFWELLSIYFSHEVLVMFSWFKTDPKKQIKKQIQKKFKQAMEYQRNGKLLEYAETIAEIENMEEELRSM